MPKVSSFFETHEPSSVGQEGGEQVHFTGQDVTQASMFSPSEQEHLRNQEIGDYKIVGQLRNLYILLESKDALYYIDQHALAERILFEKIKS